MRIQRSAATTVAAIVFASGISSGGVRADSAADFYKGKQVTMLVGVGLGSSYGTHSRLYTEALKRYLPGKPNIVVQSMPGAGSAKMVNYLYNVAPKDGTVYGFPFKYVAVNQALGLSGLKYDANKFSYIGSFGPINSTVSLWSATSPAKTLEEARKHTVVMGSSGKSSETFITPTLMNNLLGTKFKIVTGYKGAAPIQLAMERGEVHGIAASWDSLKAGKPDWMRDKKVVLIAQSGTKRNWDLPNLPTLLDLAQTPEQKEILGFFARGNAVGWLTMLPPGVPADRVAAMRKAFDDVMKDAKYQAEIKKRGMDISPISGQEVQQLIKETLAVSPATMKKIKAAMGG